MDEAGYGPNLGPLVIATTRWSLPGSPQEGDLWELLDAGVSRKPRDSSRIPVGDSKQLHQSGKGIAPLEASTLALLGAAGIRAGTFQDLCRQLNPDDVTTDDRPSNFEDAGPWLSEFDTPLPIAADEPSIAEATERFEQVLQQAGVGFESARADVVSEARFNRLVDVSQSKGVTLTSLSLGLLSRTWACDELTPTRIIADKHGGRNRYAAALCETFSGQLPGIVTEGLHCSTYTLGAGEISFRSKGESEFPVAVASMIAKYLREVAMELFNRY